VACARPLLAPHGPWSRGGRDAAPLGHGDRAERREHVGDRGDHSLAAPTRLHRRRPWPCGALHPDDDAGRKLLCVW
jgi:hypothetical protein